MAPAATLPSSEPAHRERVTRYRPFRPNHRPPREDPTAEPYTSLLEEEFLSTSGAGTYAAEHSFGNADSRLTAHNASEDPPELADGTHELKETVQFKYAFLLEIDDLLRDRWRQQGMNDTSGWVFERDASSGIKKGRIQYTIRAPADLLKQGKSRKLGFSEAFRNVVGESVFEKLTGNATDAILKKYTEAVSIAQSASLKLNLPDGE